MDIMEIIKDKVEDVVGKLKSDPKLMDKFQSDPVKALEDILGVDLPNEQIDAIVDAVKAKLNLDKVGDLLGGLGGLFGKK